MDNKSKKIEELLSRRVDEVIEKNHLKKKLESGKKLRIKLGIDPTSPNIHIGRAIPLLNLRDFQKLGHKIVLIIGDFTGVIGDTSDKDSERPMLTKKQIEKNMKTYIQQAAKIIDIKKSEIRYNSEWLGKLDYHEIGKQADNFSLNEFISRENIRKRLDQGKRISLKELLYPLMQAYDSVAIKADVEIGGTDQRFNLLAGRGLQRYYGQAPQDIMTNPLIEGLDGRKMSSSWGNTINLFDSANEMYGKTMSLPDKLIFKYFKLLTSIPLQEIAQMEKEMKTKKVNPKDLKALLAKEIVTMYHDKKAALKAEKEFIRIFSQKKSPSNIEGVKLKDKKLNILDLLVKTNLVLSKSEAKRLISQKGIKIDNKIQEDWKKNITIHKGMIVRAGKRKFVKII